MDHGISISLSETDPSGISDIRVDGVIDTITASELEQVIDSLVKRERFRIVIDLAGVDYISSAGWGIFISNIKLVRQNNGDIKLANMIENVREIYELLEFENVLRAYDSLSEAHAGFEGGRAESVKKKARTETKLTVTEQLTVNSSVKFTGGSAFLENSIQEIEGRVLALVRNDPFATIAEIRNDVNRRLTNGRIGWLAVYKVLRSHHLLRRRSRFKYAKSYYSK